MVRSLISGWLFLVSVLVPGPERVRWRNEWHADIDDVIASGAGPAQLMGLALGIGRAAVTFRFEGVVMDGWTKETMHAVRALLRRPGFTAVAVITLGLGIGANTAIFSVVNGVILEPLRYPDSEQLVLLRSSFPTMGFDEFWVSPPEYMEMSENLRSYSSIGAFAQFEASVGGDDQPERVEAAFASASLFGVLGVSPLLGRYFDEEEDLPGADPVVVLSHQLWQRSFGGSRDILGRSVDVNGTMATVIGVMPEGFDIDDAGIEVWIPLGLDWSNRSNHGSHFLFLVGRLAPGVEIESAQRELTQLVVDWDDVVQAGHISAEFHPLHMIELQEDIVGEVRGALFVLLGAVGFVLLIACANVANLLLARAQDRSREVAVRAAIGAGRGRLLRQFLTEGLVLSIAGAALGIALAYLSLEALQAAGPGDLPRLADIELDGRVLGFTVLLAVATGVFFGLAPSQHLSTSGLAGALREGGTRATGTASQRRLRSLLVVSETALAMILAVGAGLMIRSFAALNSVEPGFEPDGLSTFEVTLPNTTYPDAASQLAFQNDLIARLSAEPGIDRVAAMSGLPPVRRLDANDTDFEHITGEALDRIVENVDFYQAVSTGYLETMGIRVVQGRGFEAADDENSVPVALVNEALAQRFFPDRDPIGGRLQPSGSPVFMEIVGVVEDVKQAGLDQPVGTELYFHWPQSSLTGRSPNTMNLVASTELDAGSFAAAARRHVWAMDETLPVSGISTMEEVLGGAMARARFLTALLAAFAGLALVLAAVGTYGVMSYAVLQRGRELGIRMAMGAEAGKVQRLVMGQGMRIAVVGLVLGMAGAWAMTDVLESLLFGIDAKDPTTFVIGPVVLSLVAVAACWIPARRATRLDPVMVLKED